MQFHCPLKLPLLLRFLTQIFFCHENKKSPHTKLHTPLKARTETAFLSLVLTCQYILIWGLELFQHSGHHMMPISCKFSLDDLSPVEAVNMSTACGF